MNRYISAHEGSIDTCVGKASVYGTFGTALLERHFWNGTFGTEVFQLVVAYSLRIHLWPASNTWIVAAVSALPSM